MLKSLRIQNLAIIESVEIDFNEGLNVFSGETGAGKSIIMDAINLILGAKSSSDIIRTGESFTFVEAIFDIKNKPQLIDFLDEMGIPAEEDEMVIRRAIQISGKNRIFLNNTVINLSTLQKVVEQLIDFCGQSSQYLLKKKSEQLHFLDSYGKLESDLKEFQGKYHQWKKILKELEEFKKENEDKENRLEFLKFQLKDLDELNIENEKEDESISEELSVISNSESLLNFAKEAELLIHGSEIERNSIVDVLGTLVTKAEKLVEQDKSLEPVLELMATLKGTLEEVSYFLRKYTEKIDVDESRIDDLNARHSALATAKRKYGPPLSDVIKTREKFRDELEKYENSDRAIEEQEKKLAELREEMNKAMTKLSEKRKKVSEEFSEKIEKELHELNMEHAQFKIELAEQEPSVFGMDDIRLLIRSNLGSDFNTIEKIASGGEFSRIMLALHNVLATRTGVQIYLFDEVDSGISGKTAAVVGRKLNRIARNGQVICVTHLPQVASYANTHFRVEKKMNGSKENPKTFCFVLSLKKQEKVEELARMLGGLEGASEPKAVENALAMMEAASKE